MSVMDHRFDGAEQLFDAWCKGLAPDPDDTIDNWSDDNIILTSVGSAEAGPYSTARTPFLQELFLNLSPSSPVVTTILMKGAQLGASQLGLNFLGYIIAVGGGPAIVVCPTIGMAELYSKQRLGPMIAATKVLKDKIKANTGKQSGNTLLVKSFAGGMVRLTGGNSAASLKSMPAKWRLYEEPDEFPRDLEGQGNAVDLTRVRGRTFGKRAKEFVNCTPNLKSDSIIWAMYLQGDQREYTMPCPHCLKPTVWNKEMFRFTPGKPETAHMVCMHSDCGRPIDEAKHKESMMEDGTWVPQVKDGVREMPRSYYLPSFYSPIGWLSWSDIAVEIEAAEGNYEKTKTLWNTTYGLPWNDITDTPSFEAIWERRSRLYRQRDVPADVLFLAAGIDVGIDHIEVSVYGFARKGRRRLIEHVRIRGRYNEAETWQELDRFLTRKYWHPFGAAMPIRRALIDRNAWPSVVDPWVRRQDPDFVKAVRGADTTDFTIKEVSRREKNDDGTWSRDDTFKYFVAGVTMLKLELYGQLNLAWDRDTACPPGWVDLPEDIHLGYVEQLVSEEYVAKKTKGKRSKSGFQPIGSLRHEALDTTNYARAAANSLGWDYWSDADFARAEKDIRDAAMALQLEMDRCAARTGKPVTVDDLIANIVRSTDRSAIADTEPEQVSIGQAQETAVEPMDTESPEPLTVSQDTTIVSQPSGPLSHDPVPASQPTVPEPAPAATGKWAGVKSTWGTGGPARRTEEPGVVGGKPWTDMVPAIPVKASYDQEEEV